MNLPRIVDLPEESQHACNYEIKIENESNADVVAIVTPTIESRNKNWSYQNLQAEEAKKWPLLRKMLSST